MPNGFSVIGYSRAADKTAFYVPETRYLYHAAEFVFERELTLSHRWFLDAGGMAVAAHRPSHVFITHCHSDHVYNLPNLVSSRHHTNVYGPQESVELIANLVDAAQKLNANTSDTSAFYYAQMDLKGVSPGDVIEIGDKAQHVVRTVQVQAHHRLVAVGAIVRDSSLAAVVVCGLQCRHGVPCVGYLFYTKRTKLKPEFTGLPGKEIAALRKQGIEVQMSHEVPLLAFLGDTSIELFRDEATCEQLLPAFPIVFCECTALSDSDLSPEEATARGHIHWEQLREVVERYPDTTFVLIHFSSRYRPFEIREFFERQRAENPGKYLNVLAWI